MSWKKSHSPSPPSIHKRIIIEKLALITTTGLAGGLSWPYKGLFPAALVERLKRLSAALLSRLLLKQLTRGLFYRLTRKRVNILFYTYLVCDHVFLDLILYILFYFLCIFPYRIDEVTSTPEVP